MKVELNPYLKRLIVVLCCAFSTCLSSQELPPILNFPPSSYGAENQNWSIAQGEGGRIYVANNKGLLIYNGAEWQFYNSPNESIIRSVEVVQERIYTGAYMEFVHWERDKTGALAYTSLTEKLKYPSPLLLDYHSYEERKKWKECRCVPKNCSKDSGLDMLTKE